MSRLSRFALLTTLAWCSSLAHAQFPELGPAVAVDVRVTDVLWHPHGSALLYSRTEGDGKSLGVFSVSGIEGKSLLHLGKEDSWEAHWFDGASVILVTIYRKSTDGATLEMHTLDADRLEDRLVFVSKAMANDNLSVEVDTSPSLIHAIVTVSDGKKSTCLVLPNHGNKLVRGVEIDRAMQNGYAGPTWSKVGTAIYAKGEGLPQSREAEAQELAKVEADIAMARVAAKADADAEQQLLRMRLAMELDMAALMRRRRAAPAEGTNVLEVIPSSAALRQVAFQGPWQEKPKQVAEMVPQPKRTVLDFGVSKGQVNSLWLTLPQEGIDRGILISAQATNSWLAPENRAVAYISDGALFVRSIGQTP